MGTDLVEWAVQYLRTSEHFSDDPDLIELASINEKNKFEVEKAGIFLANFVKKQWPDYVLKNNKAETYAKEYFKTRLKEYLIGQYSPYELCRMVTLIEEAFDFPKWLGNMYNACDWIEPHTSRAECKYLEAEIEKTLGL